MLMLFPQGFEEVEHADGIELIAYTDPRGEEQMWAAFGAASGADVAPGWEDRWREFHRPVRAGALWIGPPWHQPPDDAVAVVIDPGRAFGTGAHPTTRLCVELLARRPRGSVLDVGCGSGVLAIAAAKLGFSPVVAIDKEEQAIDATRRNAAASGVHVDARCADALVAELPAADQALANITREVVVAVAPRLRCTSLIASGYLLSDPDVLPGFRHVERLAERGWAADLYEREHVHGPEAG
jgi:ribosomal protein L11 methyltransferase